jgi:hypothetical protein
MSLFDSFYIVGALFAFVIAAVAVGLVFQSFNNAVQTGDFAPVAKEVTGGLAGGWPGVVDWIFVALLIGLPLASMALAYFNNIPAIFFFGIIGVLFLMVFVGWGLQAGWEGIMADGGDFSIYVSSGLPMTNFILSNFGVYSLLVVAIIGFGTYVKAGREGAGVGW